MGKTARILTFENRKYEEEEFIIPAQDSKGHSERIYYRIPPGMMRDLKIILASKKFPFRTVGDIGRLATKMIIELLTGLEAIPSVNRQVDAIASIVRDEEFQQEFIGIYEQAGRVINRYISQGEESQARKMLVAIRDQIRAMPKGYWRKKYWNELNAKYGHLMKDKGVGLEHGMEEDEDPDEIE